MYNSILTRFVERVVVAGEDEPARRRGVERGDDVVEVDLLAEDGVLRVRDHLHLPVQRPHLLRYVLKGEAPLNE